MQRRLCFLSDTDYRKTFEKSHKLDIVNDEQLKEENNMFPASLKKLTIDGIGDTKHKDAI